ncbi:MAG: arginine--tRNA ligase [Mycoplasmoidaceae bacterium]|nr:MAG: arginine--tRNA ligase [Mycoplasmoidaceae bacterium]
MKYDTIIDHLNQILKKQILSNFNFKNEVNFKTEEFSPQVEKINNNNFGDFCAKFLFKLEFPVESIKMYSDYMIRKLTAKDRIFKKVEFVDPGFLNLTLTDRFINKYLKHSISKHHKRNGTKKKLFYNIEFVSADPTSSLSICDARNAVYSDTLTNIWKSNGIMVNKEYYVKDSGKKIDELVQLVFNAYLEIVKNDNKDSETNSNINNLPKFIATKIKNDNNDKYATSTTLSKSDTEYFKQTTVDWMLNDIKQTLLCLGVNFDIWFRESDIYKYNLVPNILILLKKHTYKENDTVFLRTTAYDDNKDRILIKPDKTYTYLTTDIAYHNTKLMRGYDKIFNVWECDHSSYVDYLRIAIQMLGYKKDIMNVMFQQMLKLTDSEKNNSDYTVKELVEKLGKDEVRWFLISTSLDTHLILDVNKIIENKNNNSIYYVQYAHARINQLIEKNKEVFSKSKFKSLNLLTSQGEKILKLMIIEYKMLLKQISNNYAVHKLSAYLLDLSHAFHNFYTNFKIVDESNMELSSQRYLLCGIVKRVIQSGLKLMGITPLNKMDK